MFAPLPLLHVTAINKKKSGDDKSVYSCPVYKYAKRTDKYIIFRVNLNSETDKPIKQIEIMISDGNSLFDSVAKIFISPTPNYFLKSVANNSYCRSDAYFDESSHYLPVLFNMC